MPVNDDEVSLRLLLVSGKAHVYPFKLSSTASEITRHVFANWPVEWEESPVDHHQVLRLLYRGKFLKDSTTLSELCLQSSKTVTMHLVVRQSQLPQANQRESRSSIKATPPSTHCCTIL